MEEKIDLSIYGTLPSIDDAKKLVDKYLTETRKHCEDVAKVMKYFANKT
jgi:hypothetical protein